MIKNNLILKYIMLIDLILIVFVSLYGMIDQNIYINRLNSISLSELLGEDTSNLLFSIIGLILLFINKKSVLFIRMILIGIMSYFIYMYSYYSFSIISSIFYIIYMIIFSLSLFSFIFQAIEITKIDILINNNYPRKTISYFFILVVLIMIFLELPDIINKTIFGNKTITLFQLYYILDLSIVFPSFIIISIMNLLKKKIVIIWSGIVIIKILTMMPALLLNELFYWFKNGYFLDFSFIIISCCMIFSSTIILVLFIKGVDWIHINIPEKYIT